LNVPYEFDVDRELTVILNELTKRRRWFDPILILLVQ